MKHCCDKMDELLEEGKFSLVYWPERRFYGIGERKSEHGAYRMHFCPWCGTKLPTPLSKELGHILFDELKLEDFEDPRMPEEFKTDEWWKKRGL